MVPIQADAIEQTFELSVPFSMVAHFTFGATGALAGIRRGFDVIGILFMALVTAVGGGLIRDGLLISRGPASVLTEGPTILLVLAAAGLTLIIYPQLNRLTKTIAVVDAAGLGAFAVYGVQKSLSAGLNVPSAIIGGTITAVGGGLLRDVLTREEPLVLKPGQFYALVVVCGCCLYVALPRLGWVTAHESAYITIAMMFLFRILAIRFNWRTTALGGKGLPSTPV